MVSKGMLDRGRAGQTLRYLWDVLNLESLVFSENKGQAKAEFVGFYGSIKALQLVKRLLGRYGKDDPLVWLSRRRLPVCFLSVARLTTVPGQMLRIS